MNVALASTKAVGDFLLRVLESPRRPAWEGLLVQGKGSGFQAPAFESLGERLKMQIAGSAPGLGTECGAVGNHLGKVRCH